MNIDDQLTVWNEVFMKKLVILQLDKKYIV